MLYIFLFVGLIGRAGGDDTDGQELCVIFGRGEQVSEPGFLFQIEATN